METIEETVNVVKRSRNKLLSVADQVVTAYTEKDQTVAEIASYFSCSTGTVRNLLVMKGVTMRPRGRRKSQPLGALDTD
jgi:hypothetical protein